MNAHLARLAAFALLAASSAASAAVPGAFTARYRVSQDGQPMGVATVTLRPVANGQWQLGKTSAGTGGLAALLGASTQETSTFRWRGERPEAVSYDYRSRIAGKKKQRTLRVEWASREVSVDEGRGASRYAAQPGMVERNTLPLALGLALADGDTAVSLPVAVRQKVETESFKVTGKDTVQVPAGRFAAERVERSGDAQGFSAWYVPGRYPMPVKLAQRDGGDLTLELVDYSQP
jgi:hypothetical protein